MPAMLQHENLAIGFLYNFMILIFVLNIYANKYKNRIFSY